MPFDLRVLVQAFGTCQWFRFVPRRISLSPTGKDRRKRVSDEDFTVFDDEATDSDDEGTDFGAGQPTMDYVYAFSVIASHDPQLAMVCMHFSMKAGFFNRKFLVQSSVLACVCKDLNTAFGYKGTFDGCQICLRAAQWMKREIIAEGGEKISFSISTQRDGSES